MGGKYQHGWGVLLFKMGKIAHTSHNTKHNHNTHNNQHEQLMPYYPAAMPLSLHGQGKVTPKSLPHCSPRSVRRSQAVGLALADINSLVWGAKMPPIKKEREGQFPGLSRLPLNGSTQQPTKGWRHWRVRGGGNSALCYDKGVGRFPIIWGVELSNQKMKIERAMGPWAYMATTGLEDTTTNQ
jgi:hypothetical protein